MTRVGLFGLLGSGNIGNDGSLEAVLGFLRDRHPDARLELMCAGARQVTERYGLAATPLNWFRAEYRTASGPRAILGKALGKVVDAVRTARWVRRQDVVIVPGMGVLEATLPLRPWGFPYAMFLLCASARCVGTRTALVGVGAEVIARPAVRWLVVRAARLATYRSYRDAHSRSAMGRMGVDTSGDAVYPDLAFALPVPPVAPAATGTVGVGLMAYHGGNEDRGRATEIHRAYVDGMKRFVRWLVDRGRTVRLFTGDQADRAVVEEIVADLRASRPGLDPARLVAEPTATLPELLRQMASVDVVVATRYHNVLCALKLCRPTLCIGYAAKHEVLMASAGLGEFCHSARELDLDRLKERFVALEGRSGQLRETMSARNRWNAELLEEQFSALSAVLRFDEARIG